MVKCSLDWRIDLMINTVYMIEKLLNEKHIIYTKIDENNMASQKMAKNA
jgi:hypothetical protein